MTSLLFSKQEENLGYTVTEGTLVPDQTPGKIAGSLLELSHHCGQETEQGASDAPNLQEFSGLASVRGRKLVVCHALKGQLQMNGQMFQALYNSGAEIDALDPKVTQATGMKLENLGHHPQPWLGSFQREGDKHQGRGKE